MQKHWVFRGRKKEIIEYGFLSVHNWLLKAMRSLKRLSKPDANFSRDQLNPPRIVCGRNIRDLDQSKLKYKEASIFQSI